MILDNLENRALYYLNDKFRRAFDYLINTDLDNLPLGKYDIDGENIFVIVNEYFTQQNERNILEAHKKYIDLQFIVKGSEFIEFKTLDKQSVLKEYDKKDDYTLYTATDKDRITLTEGMFVVFFPDDLHMPGILEDKSEKVKKAVVKILIDTV